MSVASLSYWAFRFTVILSVASMAGLVLFFTPLPELYFASCDRPCHELDWPMICRFRIVLESHHSMGGWCGDCPRNISDCHRPGCILADGTTRRVPAANRQLPGPSFQVCENDILVVDVVNRLAGQAVTIHWRGQRQTESPYMDGVPMVTQCPISSYTTFQYKFRAAQAGTHLWHAHTGNEMLDGLFGALIVRKPEKLEEHKAFYDVDDPGHVLVLSEWSAGVKASAVEANDTRRILVNGVAYVNAMVIPRISVQPGVKYRIRLINAGGTCPYYVNVEQHPLLVISIDGNPILPVSAAYIHFTEGERIDFVLDANRNAGVYLLKVKSNCTNSMGAVNIVYNETFSGDTTNHQATTAAKPNIPSTNVLSTVKMAAEECLPDPSIVCLTEIESLTKLPKVLASNVDVTQYLPFDYISPVEAVSPVSSDDLVPRLNNITFLFPPSPLISQNGDLGRQDVVCNHDTRPQHCQQSVVCECTQILDIALHSTVEILLINNDTYTSRDHVFHLHGNSFHVVGVSDVLDLQKNSVDDIKNLDAKGSLLKRNLASPVVKDTITVPANQIVVLRFLADSAGYWLLHDQSSAQWSRGLDLVLRVGNESDLPPMPEDFPKCGSWVGPQFFLI